MRNVKLKLEYDGTDFYGWQVQPDRRTVQGELEKAIEKLTGEKASVTGAGRTDSGVHAAGQVANFRTGSELSCNEVKRALNGILPPDIIVLNAAEAADDFHARYSATARSYMYQITKRKRALGRRTASWVKYPLDIVSMNKAAEVVLGRHDFNSFCKADSKTENRICSVSESKWEETDEIVTYRISADRFLQHMVRSLVGTMVEVGRGKSSATEFVKILNAKDRRYAGETAEAKGLMLVKVDYTTN